MYLNINRIIKNSKAEGPGNRFVIWTQGCPIRCPDCSNKDTWDFNAGKKIKLSELSYTHLIIGSLKGKVYNIVKSISSK